jgi:translocation and assembly module TamB
MITMRRLLFLLSILAFLAGIAYEGGRFFLASRYVVGKVADRLTQAYGDGVKIDKVDLGTQGSSVHGLKLYETGNESGDSPSVPWVEVDEINTDVTLWDAFRGIATVHRLTLKGASIHLHFDKDGRLLTRLPKNEGENAAVPAIHILNSQVTIQQDGRASMTITHINGDVHPESGGLAVTGKIEDPTWGAWTVNAYWNQQVGQGSARLTCPRTHLTQAKVEAIPFVPASVWREVNGLDGDTQVSLAFSTAAGDGKVHLLLNLEPIKMAVCIPSIDLGGELFGGTVVVKDGLVELRKLAAHTAGGELTTSGNLDFRDGKQIRLEFEIDAKGLDLVKLPAKWDLPRQITGNLSTVGKAKLLLEIRDGQLTTSGEGDAIITNARLAGDPLTRPIELKLRPMGKGFHFAQPTSAAVDRAAVLFQIVTLFAPRSEPLDWVVLLPGRLLNDLTTGLHFLSRSILDAGRKARSLLPEHVPAAPAADQPGYLQVKLGLDNVDLAPLIKNLGVQLPFAVAGKVSFDLQVRIPTDNPRDLKTYWLKGSASLAWLTLEGLRLDDVRARVSYANGVLHLEELTGKMPAAGGPAPEKSPETAVGSFDGRARLELFPPKDLHAWVTLRRMPLKRLASLVPGLDNNVAGVFTGTVSLRAPTERLPDVKTWDAISSMESDRLQLFGAVLEKLSAELKLFDGQFSVSDLKGNLEGGPITGSAELALAEPYLYQARLSLRDVGLDMLDRLTANFRAPVAIDGRFTLDMEARGTLNPVTVGFKGKAKARDLKVDKFNVGNLAFNWDSDGKRLNLEDIQVALYRGELTGQATLPLQPKETGSVDVRFEKLDLSTLAASLPPLPVRLEGRADGTLKANAAPILDKGSRDWVTDMSLRSNQLKLQGISAQAVAGTVTYKQQDLAYRFEGKTLGGTFQIEGKIPTSQRAAPPPPPSEPPDGLQGSFRFKSIRLLRAWEWLGLENILGPLRGGVNIALNYQADGDGKLAGQGAFSISGLRWGETRFFEDILPGWIVLKQDELHFGLSTSGLGGLLNVRAAVNIRHPGRRKFDIRMERVDLAHLLAPWPEYSSRLRGFLVAHIRGSLGSDWEGNGTVELVGGSVYGIKVSEWSLPTSFTYSPNNHRGMLTVHDSTLRFQTGRATGKSQLTWGGETRLESRLNFSNVELRHLMQDNSELAHFGSGHVLGQLDFGGNNLRSVNDLTASLTATLKKTQALQFPILLQLNPYLPGKMSSAMVFEEGHLCARLAGGVVRIERLSLQSRAARLFMEGTVTVPQGRLNLETTVSTGGLCLPQGLMRLASIGREDPALVPVSLLLEAASHLATLVVHLQVTGTVQAPIIRLQILRELSKEALHFFVF